MNYLAFGASLASFAHELDIDLIEEYQEFDYTFGLEFELVYLLAVGELQKKDECFAVVNEDIELAAFAAVAEGYDTVVAVADMMDIDFDLADFEYIVFAGIADIDSAEEFDF